MEELHTNALKPEERAHHQEGHLVQMRGLHPLFVIMPHIFNCFGERLNKRKKKKCASRKLPRLQ